MCKKLIGLVVFILALGLSGAALATDYYVSPNGNDNNTGTSPEAAWQTIDKVNSVSFGDGDRSQPYYRWRREYSCIKKGGVV